MKPSSEDPGVELLQDSSDFWLSTPSEADTSSSTEGERRDQLADNLASCESGIATQLYRSCWIQLSRVTDTLARPDNETRSLVQNIKHKFVAFGCSLQKGKLEFCLNESGELRENVTSILYEIGNLLAYGILILGKKFSEEQSSEANLPMQMFSCPPTQSWIMRCSFRRMLQQKISGNALH